MLALAESSSCNFASPSACVVGDDSEGDIQGKMLGVLCIVISKASIIDRALTGVLGPKVLKKKR